MKCDSSMRWLIPAILISSILILFNSCGGGSDSGTNNNPATTGTISGSVSGTTVIAVDDSGEIVTSDDTKGRIPDLDRDNDSINESYSFILTGVPIDLNIRIYLVTNEGVFPMNFDDNGSVVNVLSLSSATDIDLGYVEAVGGEAIPDNNPLDNPGINSEGADSSLLTISGATINDFAGTWKGNVPYLMEDGESGTAIVTLILSVNGDLLVGTLRDDSEETTVDVTGTENSGIFTFDLPTAEPENPDCVNWDVSFTAILDSDLVRMDLTGAGTFCGLGGGKQGSFSGYLNLISNKLMNNEPF